MIMEAEPTQYAMIMEAKPTQSSYPAVYDHGGEAHAVELSCGL